MELRILGSGCTKRYAQRSEAILAAAAQLFNDRGVRGVTLADVAARVGLVKNSVTYYYRRKEDLAAACFLRTIDVFTAIIERVQALDTPPERVRELLRMHLELHAAIDAGTHAPVMAFRDIRALTPPTAAEVFDAYTAMFRRVRSLLKGAATQRLRQDELNARAHILVSLVNRMPELVRGRDARELDALLENQCDILFGGLLGQRSGWQEQGPEQDWLAMMQGDEPGGGFLQAATQLVNDQGYRGASVSRISERLQLTKGGFYYYNAGKDDLVRQCFARSFWIMRRAIELAQQHAGDSSQRIGMLVRALVRFQLSSAGPLLRSTASSALPHPGQRAEVAETFARLRERITGMIVAGMVDGSIRETDAFLASHYLVTSIDAAAELGRWVRGASEANVAILYACPMLMGLFCEPPGCEKRGQAGRS